MPVTQLFKERAYDLGFDLIGVAPAKRAPHADAYSAWIEAGYAAGMAYMARSPERRQDPRLVLREARSVVVVGVSYFTSHPPADVWNDPSRGRIARFAWGPDYHDVILPRLLELADFLAAHLPRPVVYRSYVDTGPLLERDFACLAGLGFIGKNTCLIRPGLGSFLFLGEILVNVELEYDAPSPGCLSEENTTTHGGHGGKRHIARHAYVDGAPVGGCGTCVRCLKQCPTQALAAPYVLNSRRCISYLTIEHKGSIPVDLRPSMGNWIFGCDACQAACPWPRRFSQPAARPFLHFEADTCAPELLSLIDLNEEEFQIRFRGTPVLRAKRRGLLRNVAVAIGNWGEPEAIPALKKAAEDPEELVREHALWALDRIRSRT